jgi:hypothetical protein
MAEDVRGHPHHFNGPCSSTSWNFREEKWMPDQVRHDEAAKKPKFPMKRVTQVKR